MGERKDSNKYYPSEFDPSKLPKVRRPKNQQMKVQMMLPMSIFCNSCGNYIYKGTKFNSRKENAISETDTQNSNYIVKSGATRNFEPWRAEDEEVEKEKQKRESEEMRDAMKSLENRTLDSKREMDILAALDEMKSMKMMMGTDRYFCHFDLNLINLATNGKWRAIVVEISRMNKTDRLVLVGTLSVEQSDSLLEQLQEARFVKYSVRVVLALPFPFSSPFS
ncbi:hypothetical protein REPUB_Repub01dG0089300 [Reevesia pubescens]